MYSTVNKATTLVSRPNHTRPEIERTAGTVSRTVTTADKMIKKVVNIWTRNAEDDDAGCSRIWNTVLFQGGSMIWDSSSSELCSAILSTEPCGECSREPSSVKNLTEFSGGGRLSLLSSMVGVVAIKQVLEPAMRRLLTGIPTGQDRGYKYTSTG